MSWFNVRDERRVVARRASDQEMRQLSTLLDRLPAGLLTIARGGKIVYSNEAARAILGFVQSDQILAGDALRPYPAILSLMEMAAFSGEPLRGIEVRLETPHRGEVHVVLDAGLSRNAEAFQIDVLFFDITSIKQREEALRVKDRLAAIGEVAASMAHQLKSPLANILMYLQRLKVKMPTDHPVTEFASGALTEAERLDTLVRTLLDTTGPARLAIAELDVEAFVRALSAAAKPLASAAGGQVVTECQSALPKMRGDAEALRSAFMNLFSNSIEAGATRITISARHRQSGSGDSRRREKLSLSPTGTISYCFSSEDVRFPEDDGSLLDITVSDNGRGVGPEDMKRLFTPFFTTKPHGTGMGLIAVHKIVEAHHGGIMFRSKRGRGSEVIISLPCHG